MIYRITVLLRDEECRLFRNQVYDFSSMKDVKTFFEVALAMKWSILGFDQIKKGNV